MYLFCGPEVERDCFDPNRIEQGEVEGCFCVPGYLRNLNGTCIEAGQCGTDQANWLEKFIELLMFLFE